MTNVRRVLVGLVSLMCVVAGNQVFAESLPLVPNGDFNQVKAATGKWSEQAPLVWNDLWIPTGTPKVAIIPEPELPSNQVFLINASEKSRVALSQDIPVEKNQSYKVTARVKTEGVTSAQGARVRILRHAKGKQVDPLSYSTSAKGTSDWQTVTALVKSEGEIDSFRLQLFLEEGTGKVYFDDVTLEKVIELTSLSFKEKSVDLVEGDSLLPEVIIEPSSYSVEKLKWTSSNEQVVTVVAGKLQAKSQGQAVVSISSPDGQLRSELVVSVKGASGSQLLPEYQAKQRLQSGKLSFLFSQQLPANFKTVSSQPEVATVNGGTVLAGEAGASLVTVTDEQNQVVGTIDVIVEAQVADNFDKMRHSWEDIIFGGRYYDPNNQQMKDAHGAKEKDAEQAWLNLNKNPERDYLWLAFSNRQDSSTLTKNYRELYKLAEASMNPYSAYYLNERLLQDVIGALEWLNVNRYNENLSIVGNWWDYEIGASRALNDTLTMVYGALTQEQLSRFLKAVDKFVPDARYIFGSIPERKELALGGNQIDISKVKLIQNVLLKNEKEVMLAKEALKTVLPLVKEGEGFYQDGSFISHTNVAYTGAYGNVLIDGLSQLLTVIQPSPYALESDSLEIVNLWVEKAFQPLIYKGSLMDMSRGRSISRSGNQDHKAAVEVLRAILRYSEFASPKKNQSIKEFIKYQIEEDTFFDYLKSITSYRDIDLAQSLLASTVIQAVQPETKLTNFANMDKVSLYNRNKDFGIGVSLHSTRTQNYEDMNNENRRGWYTGDGMMYLYNGDLGQYSDNYWATVNPYRLAGTTVETGQRVDGSGEQVGPSAFVGGAVSLSQNGAFAMTFGNWNKQLSAKKAWFVLGDKIVSLGADIQSKSDQSIETIVENRKLVAKSSYGLYLDGIKTEIANQQELTLKEKGTVFVEGPTVDQSIGYQLLTDGSYHILKENRSGSWKEINYTEKADSLRNDFITIWQNHGNKVVNGSYGYVTYPNLSQSEFASTTKNSAVELLENSATVQSVVDKELQTTGVIMYQSIDYKVENITLKHAGVYLVEKKKDKVLLSLSDPTMTKNQTLQLTVAKADYEVKSQENLTIKEVGANYELSIAVSEGKTSQLVLTRKKSEVIPPEETTTDTTSSTSTSDTSTTDTTSSTSTSDTSTTDTTSSTSTSDTSTTDTTSSTSTSDTSSNSTATSDTGASSTSDTTKEKETGLIGGSSKGTSNPPQSSQNLKKVSGKSLLPKTGEKSSLTIVVSGLLLIFSGIVLTSTNKRLKG